MNTSMLTGHHCLNPQLPKPSTLNSSFHFSFLPEEPYIIPISQGIIVQGFRPLHYLRPCSDFSMLEVTFPWRLEGSGTADSGNLGPRHSAEGSGASKISFIHRTCNNLSYSFLGSRGSSSRKKGREDFFVF